MVVMVTVTAMVMVVAMAVVVVTVMMVLRGDGANRGAPVPSEASALHPGSTQRTFRQRLPQLGRCPRVDARSPWLVGRAYLMCAGTGKQCLELIEA